MKNYLQDNVNFNSLVALFSQTPVALALFKGEDMILEAANQKSLEVWMKDENIIGKPFTEAFPTSKDHSILEIMKNVFRTGETFVGEKIYMLTQSVDGSYHHRYYDFTFSPVKDNNDKIVGVSAISHNVTSQVNSENQLADSQRKFKDLILNAEFPTAIYRGEELIIELANEKMLKAWGKDSSVIGMPLEKALPELERQPFIQLLKNVYSSGETYSAKEDKVDLMVDGKLQSYYFSFSYKAIRNASGDIDGIINMALDVTEIVKARELAEKVTKKLKLSEKQYRDLSEAMPHMVWTCDENQNITYFNKKTEKFFGCSIEENTPNLLDLIFQDDLNAFNAAWKKAIDNKTSFEIEHRSCSDDAQDCIWFLTRAIPEFDEYGNLVQWIGSSTDINEFKILQNHKDTFLSIASHELKTPLTSIKIYAQFLERALKKIGDAKNAEFAKKMDEQIIKLTNLIGELLDVTKINTGKIQLNEDYFNFKELIDDVVDEQQLSTSHIIVNNTKPVGTIYADKNRISQVITNLISNAIKYSPDAKEIVLETSIDDEFVQLCVKDFGIGMPEDKIDKVFEQYYRVSGDEQHTFSGLGLGLYIASQIVERSNGKIWVNSVLGKGSTFCFSLPKRNN